MSKIVHRIQILMVAVIVVVLTVTTSAQDQFPPAPIVNDEGGATLITGKVTYTNPFFTAGVASPVIILEDQAGFIDRNEYYVFPPESQTLGQITSDFFTSPFTYSLALPIEPQGALRDVDNDGEEDLGVMVFAVAYWANTWGDPFLEVRDLSGGGWSTAYASTEVSSDPRLNREIIGGHFLIYAPDEEQGFPGDFGADGLIFTEDDPIVSIPQGYSIVNLNESPFIFDRARNHEIDLIEPEGAALIDFSGQSYTEAFDSMLDLLSKEYAFTEYKGIDWQALEQEYRPRFVEAEQNNDSDAYYNAVREFLWNIPDGHVAMGPFSPFVQQFQFSVALGVGMGISETDDDRVLVTYLVEGGPAELAGIELGAEIIEMDGLPIDEHISRQEPWSQPFSTPHNLRLEQLRYAVRFDANTRSVPVSFRNPGDSSPTEVTLATANEVESFNNTSNQLDRGAFELPVEFDLVEDRYGYVTIASFLDNSVLTIQLWERMIQEMNNAGVPAIIIDMRQNGGGSGFLADQMAAYFFDDPHIVGSRGYYSEDLDTFYFDPRGAQRMYPPSEDLRYHGEVVVLIGPNCASACERFAYDLTIKERGEVIGQYPTAGLGGSVNDFRMPEGVTIRYTAGRSVDANGNIHIEGTGVRPTVFVPINEETLFSDGDPVLDFAIDYLDRSE